MSHTYTNTIREAAQLSDDDLAKRIDYLRKATYLGTWGERELSKCEAETTARKMNRRGKP
jgi:hypothetical protein